MPLAADRARDRRPRSGTRDEAEWLACPCSDDGEMPHIQCQQSICTVPVGQNDERRIGNANGLVPVTVNHVAGSGEVACIELR